ncbi:MAG: hypothetical protein MN733_19265 [Nitrososphaera sp.]|nr:hypothetical protein [Nitrososphaera sp.]
MSSIDDRALLERMASVREVLGLSGELPPYFCNICYLWMMRFVATEPLEDRRELIERIFAAADLTKNHGKIHALMKACLDERIAN